VPILAVGSMSVILVTNPFDLVWMLIKHSELLSQVCRSWYFLAGIMLSVAALSATGIDHFLSRQMRPAPRWLAPFTISFLALWSARQIWHWLPAGPGFAIGWSGAVEPAVMLAAFSLAIFVIVAEKGARRTSLTVALLLAVGVDYKVYGTSKRINAYPGNVDRMFARAWLPGLDDNMYRVLHEHPEYRIGLDRDNPVPMDLRHYGLTTPQGGDPLMPAQYHEVLAPDGAYYDALTLDPAKKDLLQLLAVRYFLTSPEQPLYPALNGDGGFRQITYGGYFAVFEFLKSKPPFRWDLDDTQHSIEKTYWSAERREFTVRSEKGGRFILVEQFFPGWRATIDGTLVHIERWNHAFQSIFVPAGEHRIQFVFASRGLRLGAIVSAVSLLALLLCFALSR
jgi:hypothetical protein